MKMKKLMTLVLFCAAAFASGLFAQGNKVLVRDTFGKNDAWFINPVCKKLDGGGTITFPGDGKGKYMKVVTVGKQIMMLNRRRAIPVQDGSKIKVIVTAKGKGKLELTPMGKTEKGGTVYLEGGYEKINTDEWEENPFIIRVKDKKGTKLVAVTFRLNIERNSTMLLDTLRVELMK